LNTYELSEFEAATDLRSDLFAIGQYDEAALRLQVAGSTSQTGVSENVANSTAFLLEKIGSGDWNYIPLDDRKSAALALNSIFPSQVVGWLEEDSQRFAIMWEKSGSTLLPGIGGVFSEALGINNKGQIVGRSQDLNGNFKAMVWTSKDPVNTKALPGLDGEEAEAYGINMDGTIVGRSKISSGDWHACIWPTGNNGYDTVVDIHPPQFISSIGNAINLAGNVAGQASDPSGSYPFFRSADGSLKLLGSLGGNNGNATALNDLNQVVGYSSIGPSQPVHGFFWSANDQLQDLEADLQLGTDFGVVNRANGINNAGYIAVVGRNASQRIRGAILTFLGYKLVPHPTPVGKLKVPFIPIYPPLPWLHHYLASISLASTASNVSPHLRSQVFDLALEQLAVTKSLIEAERTKATE
jgi:probable HAF family extracellular repeat protein